MSNIGNLVVTRAAGESIVIDGQIEVMVTEIRGSGKVRIRISAPRDIRIVRKELLPDSVQPHSITEC